MMKKNVLGVLFLFAMVNMGVYAQPVINDSDFAIHIGDQNSFQPVKNIYLDPSIFYGPNLTWDFSNLVDSGSVITSTVISPSGQPFSDSFPNASFCTLSSDQPNVYNYANFDQNGLKLVGSVRQASLGGHHIYRVDKFRTPINYNNPTYYTWDQLY